MNVIVIRMELIIESERCLFALKSFNDVVRKFWLVLQLSKFTILKLVKVFSENYVERRF